MYTLFIIQKEVKNVEFFTYSHILSIQQQEAISVELLTYFILVVVASLMLQFSGHHNFK